MDDPAKVTRQLALVLASGFALVAGSLLYRRSLETESGFLSATDTIVNLALLWLGTAGVHFVSTPHAERSVIRSMESAVTVVFIAVMVIVLVGAILGVG